MEIFRIKLPRVPDDRGGIVQCWGAFSVDEENRALPMVLYFSRMMYKYYSHLGFSLSNIMIK